MNPTDNTGPSESPPEPAPNPSDQPMASNDEDKSNILQQPATDSQAEAIPQHSKEPSTQAQTVAFASNSNSKFKKFTKNKKRFLLLSLASLTALIAVLYVFGFYLPNKPENVWDSGLNRSGKALKNIVAASTEKEALNKYSRSDINASLEIKGAGVDYSGTISAKYDSANSNGNLTIIDKNSAGESKLLLDFMSSVNQGSTYPDIYFRLTGISAFGLQSLLPGIEKYDNTWISVPSKFLSDTLGVDQNSNTESLNSEDFAELAQAIAKPTADYIFTSSPDRAVLQRTEIVGEEKIDGLDTVHYKATINNTNLQKYCEALVNSVFKTKAYKKATSSESEDNSEAAKNTATSCIEYGNGRLKDNQQVDVWIDKKLKVLYKVRFYQTAGTKTYVDIGQKFDSKQDTINLFVTYADEVNKSTVGLKLSNNTKSGETRFEINADFGEGESQLRGNLKLSAKPYSGDIKINKPTQSTPIDEILKSFGPNGQTPAIPNPTP